MDTGTLNEQFSPLINDHPQYAAIYQQIKQWMFENPERESFNIDELYNVVVGTPDKHGNRATYIDISEALFFLVRTQPFKRVFRLLDPMRTQMGDDYISPFDIPAVVTDIEGQDRETDSMTPESFLILKHD